MEGRWRETGGRSWGLRGLVPAYEIAGRDVLLDRMVAARTVARARRDRETRHLGRARLVRLPQRVRKGYPAVKGPHTNGVAATGRANGGAGGGSRRTSERGGDADARGTRDAAHGRGAQEREPVR